MNRVKRALQKSIPFQVEDMKSADGKTSITGFASTFGGEPDHYGDVVVKGAFEGTLKEMSEGTRDIVLLFNHDSNEVIGRIKTAEETEKGLLVEAEISNTPRGSEVATLIKDGALKSFSIGYYLKDYEYTQDGVCLLKEIDLFEISVVTFPANESAAILAAKAREEEMSVESSEWADAIIKNGEKMYQLGVEAGKKMATSDTGAKLSVDWDRIIKEVTDRLREEVESTEEEDTPDEPETDEATTEDESEGEESNESGDSDEETPTEDTDDGAGKPSEDEEVAIKLKDIIEQMSALTKKHEEKE